MSLSEERWVYCSLTISHTGVTCFIRPMMFRHSSGLCCRMVSAQRWAYSWMGVSLVAMRGSM